MLEQFHPAVAGWFRKAFSQPTACQAQAWPAIQARRHALIAAPTGSGKTFAAFLSAIDDLVRQGQDGTLADETQVVYISPLKALSNDIQRNLEQPLAAIRDELLTRGLADVEVRTLVRTGDTPAAAREAMRRRPPHIIVTTPESLYILLTSEGGRNILRTTRTVIVDEIHAIAGSKRGSHLSLSLERLQALTGSDLVRIGLSATQKPIDEIARFLVGADDTSPECTIIDTGYTRERDLAIEIPRSPLEAVMAGEVWDEVYNRLAELIAQHRTTLIFVNTRRMAERVARHLSERIGEENVTSHHGSLAREQRLAAEQRLKAGELRALVATASLELGIDIGDVDLVCQLGSTRAIATLLQRVGRSGHSLAGVPKGRLFPFSRDELVEATALLDAVRRGELDRLMIPEKPLDVLAQQVVAAVACGEWDEQELYACMRRAYPYRNLTREEYTAVVRMIAEGYSTRRGRRGAYVHRDPVNNKLRPRRGARLTAITNGGAIPDNADYDVVLEPEGSFIGTLNEDFAIESLPGDIFQLGNASWRILRIEAGRVRVEDAKGQPPNIPFWIGEAPTRTHELSHAVSRLRAEVSQRLTPHPSPSPSPTRGEGMEPAEGTSTTAVRWLVEEVGISEAAAVQIVDYLATGQAALGVMPTQQDLVLERFFDESGGMQLVVHSPFGSRLNRAWGLALRKRFCRKFNFELQAAATEDAIVLSLGLTHSFPLDEVARYLHSGSARDVLTQALLAAPMFTVRWRWNAACALAILRARGGKKVAPQLQRMQAEDLLAVVFPDQLACAENISGQREIPEHPLAQQTVRDCLTEAMDIDALEQLLADLEAGNRHVHARDLTEPSPLAQEILNARPYAFLDDAPLEERRTQAVLSRRWLDVESAAELGTLDAAAIDRVRHEASPQIENADEMYDSLVLLGFIGNDEAQRGSIDGSRDAKAVTPTWQDLLETLRIECRAAQIFAGAHGPTLWVAAERLPQLQAVFGNAIATPSLDVPEEFAAQSWTREQALVELMRGRLEVLGPTTARALADSLGLGTNEIELALLTLESEGFVLRGRFTPQAQETEWCERRLLARIHRYTINRLRQEIEPVSAADYMRFLLSWQHTGSEEQPQGPHALLSVIEQLAGFEAPAAAWEADILPARMLDYDPAWLDSLCLAGKIAWTRLTPRKNGNGSERVAAPVRSTPIALVVRKHLSAWSTSIGDSRAEQPKLSASATTVTEYLRVRGASFFQELVDGTGLLNTQVEEALGELVAWGLVISDSFSGLRALLVPSNKRRPLHGVRHRRKVASFGIEDAGRWALTAPLAPSEEDRPNLAKAAARVHTQRATPLNSESVEQIARTLLNRYGVVFRRVLERESALPPWRELLRVYRRLEARGEIRGGRFVAGFSGEQYALPEAVGTLREVRRRPAPGGFVSLSAADPLNLVGIVTPGQRLPALTANRVLYQNGMPIALLAAGEVRFLGKPETASEWEAQNMLRRRPIPPPLRVYLE